MTEETRQQFVDILLEITPNCVDYVEIHPSEERRCWGQAACTISRDAITKNPISKKFYIRTPPPLESGPNLLTFLHECAHIELGHINAEPILNSIPFKIRPVHPHYNTYFLEIMAWAKVDRWLKQYNIWVDGKKDYVLMALENAWRTLK